MIKLVPLWKLNPDNVCFRPRVIETNRELTGVCRKPWSGTSLKISWPDKQSSAGSLRVPFNPDVIQDANRLRHVLDRIEFGIRELEIGKAALQLTAQIIFALRIVRRSKSFPPFS